MRVRLLNIEIDTYTLQSFLEAFDQGLVVTPNVDHMITLQENAEFLDIYRSAEFVLVDSQILFWVLRRLGRPVPEKLSGSDVFPAFCRFHAGHPEVSVFLLGGKPGVADAAMKAINQRVGRDIVIAGLSPSMQFVDDAQEIDHAIEVINASGADTLALGLGTPKQELWLHRHRHRLIHVRRFMAVGATLDFEAGTVQRAPAWMSRWGMEWLYRLIQEPARLGKRYLIRDPKFFYLLLVDEWRQRFR